MFSKTFAVSAAGFMMMAAGVATADTITATITADNHYALYTSTGEAFSLIGRNEMGSEGSTGGYNWSQAETWTFEAADFIYIAGWSDDAVAQGILADIRSVNSAFHSGDARWEVIAAGENLGDGSPAPTISDIASRVAFADLNNTWETPFTGGTNGMNPWGGIAGIDPGINWMWRSSTENANPLIGGADHEEYLIFRMPTSVPAPGALALAGIGCLGLARRRR
jgi:hypothetical protein